MILLLMIIAICPVPILEDIFKKLSLHLHLLEMLAAVVWTLLYTWGSVTMDWSSSRLKVRRWVKKWVLWVLLNFVTYERVSYDGLSAICINILGIWSLSFWKLLQIYFVTSSEKLLKYNLFISLPCFWNYHRCPQHKIQHM
jgi:hypothetical protein